MGGTKQLQEWSVGCSTKISPVSSLELTLPEMCWVAGFDEREGCHTRERWNSAKAAQSTFPGGVPRVSAGSRGCTSGLGAMGKGGATKKTKKKEAADDALLDAAIAENKVIQEKEASKAAAAAAKVAEAVASITAALDKLPTFTIANRERKPLQFNIGGKETSVFYADVAAAKLQLAATKKEAPDCDLIAVGLGSAYRLACDGRATIVPGLAELQAAGAPADAQPLGQELPLFACMQLSRYMDGGGLVVPIFMCYADCEKEVAAATNPDANEDPLSITPLSLSSVVEQLNDPSGPAFTFVAPTASVQFTQTYVGEGVYMRRTEVAPDPEPDSMPPPLASSEPPPEPPPLASSAEPVVAT